MFPLVVKGISKDWKKLGRALEIEDSVLDNIEVMNNAYGLEEMANQMMRIWQQQAPECCNPDTLVTCVKKIKREDIVARILEPERLRDQSTRNIDTEENFLKDIQLKLRDCYSNLMLRGLPWMEEYINLSLENHYADLILNLNDINLSSKPIKLEQIFTPMDLGKKKWMWEQRTKNKEQKNKEQRNGCGNKEKPSRILLEGAMGHGKTSLASKLCFDWARNTKYINYFDLVLFLPLRNFDGGLNEMLFKSSRLSNDKHCEFNILLNDKSKQLLIILDGLDELNSIHEKDILPLLQKDVFCHTTVVVTSRPGKAFCNMPSENDQWFEYRTGVAVNKYSLLWERKINIVGISKSMQNEFIQKYLQNDPEELRVALNHPLQISSTTLLLSECLKSPLFLLMFIILKTEYKTMNVKTYTDLYKCLFNFVLRRYLTVKKNYSSSQRFDMFQFEIPCKYVDLMAKFGEACFTALKLDKSFFYEEELPLINGICEVSEIGFLTKGVSQKGLKTRVTYEPIHKSMMEFAAAYFLWLSFIKGSRDCWFKYASHLKSLRPQFNSGGCSYLFLFLSGLLGKDAGALFDVLKPFASEYNESFGSLSYLLMEIESTDICNDICGLNEHSLSCSLLTVLPTTWVVPWENDDHNFSKSDQHTSVLQLGIAANKIKRIKWNVHQEATFPQNLKIGALIVEFSNPEAPVFASRHKLSCETLVVLMQSARKDPESIQTVIKAINFDRMYVDLRYDGYMVMICYNDIITAMADVQSNMIYLSDFDLTFFHSCLISNLSTLVRQNALETLHMKVEPPGLPITYRFFSLIIHGFFLFALSTNYYQDHFSISEFSLCLFYFIFILTVLNRVFDMTLYLVKHRIPSVVFRTHLIRFWVHCTRSLCQYTLFRALTRILLFDNTPFLLLFFVYKAVVDFYSIDSILCVLWFVIKGIFLNTLWNFISFGYGIYLHNTPTYNRIDLSSPKGISSMVLKNGFFPGCFWLLLYVVAYIYLPACSVSPVWNLNPLVIAIPLIYQDYVYSRLCKLITLLMVVEKPFEMLIKQAGTSTALQTFAFRNPCSLEWSLKYNLLFTVDLSDLCHRGLKPWNWLQLEDVEIRCSKNILKQFEIQHFDFSNAKVTDLDECSYFFGVCRLTSVVCSSSFLTASKEFWSLQQRFLKELYVVLDGLFAFSTEMQNLNIIGVTMTINSESSLSSSMCLLNGYHVKGVEVWSIEKNCPAAMGLVENIVHMLGINSEPDYLKQSNCHSSSKGVNRLKLEYLMLLTDHTPNIQLNHPLPSSDIDIMLELFSLIAVLKKPVKEKSLARLDIVCHRDVVHCMSIHESNQISGSWTKVFPPEEGFQVTHDLWGTQSYDSLRSKGIARMYPDKYHRFSIKHRALSNSGI